MIISVCLSVCLSLPLSLSLSLCLSLPPPPTASVHVPHNSYARQVLSIPLSAKADPCCPRWSRSEGTSQQLGLETPTGTETVCTCRIVCMHTRIACAGGAGARLTRGRRSRSLLFLPWLSGHRWRRWIFSGLVATCSPRAFLCLSCPAFSKSARETILLYVHRSELAY